MTTELRDKLLHLFAFTNEIELCKATIEWHTNVGSQYLTMMDEGKNRSHIAEEEKAELLELERYRQAVESILIERDDEPEVVARFILCGIFHISKQIQQTKSPEQPSKLPEVVYNLLQLSSLTTSDYFKMIGCPPDTEDWVLKLIVFIETSSWTPREDWTIPTEHQIQKEEEKAILKLTPPAA